VDSPLPPRYRVIRRVAVGGMGSIWAAEDEVLKRRVAVKVLAEQLTSQPLFVERFEREARMAAGLSGHPHVITIYDVGEHDSRLFIVMEFLAGGTIRDQLRLGRPERPRALAWLRETAAGLDFVHARGVVHRDVKPQNLLLDGDGRLVIADLGIARAAFEDSLTATGELLGTACYISPEQARGEAATPASDRYSLAVVAYELLTGARPFDGASFAEQALQQAEHDPEPPSMRSPDLSTAVDGVLLKGLSQRPEARWANAGEFVAALDEALAEPPHGGGPSLAEPRVRPRRISAGALAGAAVVVLFTAGAIGLIASDHDSSPEPAKRASGGKPAHAEKAGAGAPAPTPGNAASAAQLNDRGFQLMRAGRYQQAIPLLRRAVAAFPQGSTDLTYAYALYNLGRSLRLAGRPREAIPLLERRLRFDNQRDVVARELAASRHAVG